MKSRGRLNKLAQVSEKVLPPTPPPQGGTPLNGLYGKAKPESRPASKRVRFFRLQVYEKLGNSLLIQVYKRGGKSFISVRKRTQKPAGLKDSSWAAKRTSKLSGLVIYS